MGTILPLHMLRIDEPFIDLVDQSGGLKSMTRPLLTHVAVGQSTEFVINEGNQTIKGFLLATTPGQQQAGDFRPLFRRHSFAPPCIVHTLASYAVFHLLAVLDLDSRLPYCRLQ